jgi:ubiquinone biosynthesis protein UbiJ
MTTDLSLTNVFLGIMAAVSLLEALAVFGLFLGGFLLYRRLMHVISGIEERHVAPASARVNAILEDVKGVTSTVKAEADRVDRLIRWLIRP